MFKRDGEPEPSGEGVDALVGYQPPARRVGTLLELKGDTHRTGLIHTGQHRRRGWRAASRCHRCFYRPSGGAGVPGAVDRSAAGSWPRELMDSFW